MFTGFSEWQKETERESSRAEKTVFTNTPKITDDFMRFLLLLAEIHRGGHGHSHSDEKLEKILMKLSELESSVNSLVVQVIKIKDEIVAKIGDLEDALADTEIPGPALDRLERLKESIAALDAIVPDEVVEPPVEPPVE